MELKAALVGQFRATLAMLRECIEKCPDAMWAAGEHPRTFWRIAYHTLYFTHMYLMPKREDFVPWEKHQNQGYILWDDDEDGMPPVETTYSQVELLGYLDFMMENIDEWVQALDLESPESGFSWYKIPKLDHMLLNLRHLGIHVGQLEELIYATGTVKELEWITKR